MIVQSDFGTRFWSLNWFSWRDDGLFKAELACLTHARIRLRDSSYFATEANFTKDNRPRV